MATNIVERKTRLVLLTPVTAPSWDSKREKARPGERVITRRFRKQREIVAEVKPFGLELRLKGTRKHVYQISWDDIYFTAAKRHADKIVAERKASRKKAHR